MKKCTIDYFENMFTVIDTEFCKKHWGAYVAYRSYRRSMERNGKQFICEELPWSDRLEEFDEFVKVLASAGVKKVIVTDKSTALVNSLHKLTKYGCKLGKLCTVEERTPWGTFEEIPAIELKIEYKPIENEEENK